MVELTVDQCQKHADVLQANNKIGINSRNGKLSRTAQKSAQIVMTFH